ncbi:MAG: FAD-dependent oxidoreductase, partial [Planctomycetales bacterium]|nr:FAD-dependent oxidoreductase [Planctomycetales bacterium]
YRCLYSKNIENLFMAGRCISVTHEALGTVRVMKTCGMMGEVVGRAASVCTLHQCTPREVYDKYWSDLDALLQLPGKARRATVDDEIEIPADALELAGPNGPLPGLDPKKLPGLVIDDRDAIKQGKWTEGTGLKGYIAWGYLYASGADAEIRFDFTAPATGKFEIRYAYLPHENRAGAAKIDVSIEGRRPQSTVVNMKQAAPLPQDFCSLGTFELTKGEQGSVIARAAGAQGVLHADAIQLVPAP